MKYKLMSFNSYTPPPPIWEPLFTTQGIFLECQFDLCFDETE